ncbi:MAG: cytochrome ubiquinol oxidase subunit I [Opitutaceae bacterium]|nr:cytochrome ubiquinol oxidase subunit I [Opitutaceae bacterium]
MLGPQIANQAGWWAAEVGRQPWIVYNLLRTSEALSAVVSASQVVASMVMFGVVYLLLFAVFVFLLNEKIQHGPDDTDLHPSRKLGPALAAGKGTGSGMNFSDLWTSTRSGSSSWASSSRATSSSTASISGVGPCISSPQEDEDRRVFLNAIRPVWDGNEVWLVTGGGALFAGVPRQSTPPSSPASTSPSWLLLVA